MTVAIHIDRLSHTYEREPVLVNVSVTIPERTFFIIIGANGSGKTTLLKLLTGLIPCRCGNIHLFGRNLSTYRRKPLARLLAYVPQTFQPDFPFTVQQVVMMGRSPHQGLLGVETAEDDEVVRQAMQFTGVAHLAARHLKQLSGGERQRVLMARAISQQPQILLLDEPTAALDLAHQVRVMDLMEQLIVEKGLTVVMVSHDLNLAAMYADTLLLLKSGRSLSIGPPATVLTFETLEEAYGCTLLVDQSPLGDFPRVTLVPRKIMAQHRQRYGATSRH